MQEETFKNNIFKLKIVCQKIFIMEYSPLTWYAAIGQKVFFFNSCIMSR